MFNAAAALSVVLCVVTVVLWVRSYSLYEKFYFSRLWTSPVVHSVNGQVGVEKEQSEDWAFLIPRYWRIAHRSTPVGVKDYHLDLLRDVVRTGPHFFRVGMATRNPGWFTVPPTMIHYFAAPDWLIATVFAVLPIAWLAKFRRRPPQLKRGKCAVCGYDLRATPDRCPECGTAVLPSPRYSGERAG